MSPAIPPKETNPLFPVFLKLEELPVLIVGGGKIGLEKLQALLDNAPALTVRLVGITISEEIKALARSNPGLTLEERTFLPGDLEGRKIVMVAIDDKEESARISKMAREKGILVNAADKPGLCDFYLGSIVRKGNLKIAISTNGKSPTIAKRLKELFSELLPEELDELLDNMQEIRSRLGGDFADRVNQLNALTKGLVPDKKKDPS